MKQFFTVICLSFLMMNCSVTENIVFNENMGGTFKSTFDLSQVLTMANEASPKTGEEMPLKSIDTTIVFNEFMESYKDSIASLPVEKQKQLNGMKDVVIHVLMDEEKGIFNFTMDKPFVNFEELKLVNEQLDGAMKIAETFSKNDADGTMSAPDQMDEFTKSDPVTYTFNNNTFTRFQPKNDITTDPIEDEDATESQDMADMFKVQFEDLYKAAFYTMTYTFPKPIKSVSNKEAVLSADRKTMTLKTNLYDIDKDETLMNLEVILED